MKNHLKDMLDYSFKSPIDKIVLLKQNLDPTFLKEIKLYSEYYSNFTLGLMYSNAYSQLFLKQSNLTISTNKLNPNTLTKQYQIRALNNIILIRNVISGSHQNSKILNGIIDIVNDTKSEFNNKFTKDIIQQIAQYYKSEDLFSDVVEISDSDIQEINQTNNQTNQTNQTNNNIKFLSDTEKDNNIISFFKKYKYPIDINSNGDKIINYINKTIITSGSGSAHINRSIFIIDSFSEKDIDKIEYNSHPNIVNHIKNWSSKFEQILISNIDLFSGHTTIHTSIQKIKELLNTSTSTPTDEDKFNARKELYNLIMTTIDEEILITYTKIGIAPYELTDIEFHILAKTLSRRIIINEANSKIKLFDPTQQITPPTSPIYFYSDGSNNYKVYTDDKITYDEIANQFKHIIKPYEDLVSIQMQTQSGGERNVIDKFFDSLTSEITMANQSKTRNITDKLTDFINSLTEESIGKITNRTKFYETESKGVAYIQTDDLNSINKKINLLNITDTVSDLKSNIDKYYERIRNYINTCNESLDRIESEKKLYEIKYFLSGKKEDFRAKSSEIESSIYDSFKEIEESKRELTKSFDALNEKTNNNEDTTSEKKDYTEKFDKYKLIQSNIYKLVGDKYIYVSINNKIGELIAIIKANLKNKKMESIGFEKQKNIIDGINNATNKDAYGKSIIDKEKLKESLKSKLKTYDITTFSESNENNMSLVSRFDKILTESINAIKVYVKARDEVGQKTDKIKPKDNCLILDNKAYGKFEKIYWTNTKLSDLYCGEDVDCELKVPLSKGIRDTTLTGFKSNIYYTEGFSGSGKTTLLLGLPNNSDDKNSTGVISRIIQDLFDNIVIPSSGKSIEIEYLIGEVYGEKETLNIRDSNYSECLYFWNLKNNEPIEEQIGYNSKFDEKISTTFINLKKSRSIYSQLDSTNKFKISEFDKIKYLTLDGKNNAKDFTENTANFDKFINLKEYLSDTSSITDRSDYSKAFTVGLKNPTNLYNILTGSDGNNNFYKKFTSRIIFFKNDIKEVSKQFTTELNDKINSIQNLRRQNNRVRCTKYNPDSSRSHMFFIFRLQIGTDFKYYTFIDKAGNEIPYNIAVEEFSKLADRVDGSTILFTAKNPVSEIFSTKLDSEADADLKNIFLNKLDIVETDWEIDNQKNNTTTKTFSVKLSKSANINFTLDTTIGKKKEDVEVNVGSSVGKSEIFKIDNCDINIKFKFKSDNYESDEYIMNFPNHTSDLEIKISDIEKIIRKSYNDQNPNSMKEAPDITNIHLKLSEKNINNSIEKMILHKKPDTNISNTATKSINNFITSINDSIEKIKPSTSTSTSDNILVFNTGYIFNLKLINITSETLNISIDASFTITFENIAPITKFEIPDEIQNNIIDKEITILYTNSKLDITTYKTLYLILTYIKNNSDIYEKHRSMSSSLLNKLNKQHIRFYKKNIEINTSDQIVDTYKELIDKNKTNREEILTYIKNINLAIDHLELVTLINRLFIETSSYLIKQINSIITVSNSEKDKIIKRFQDSINQKKSPDDKNQLFDTKQKDCLIEIIKSKQKYSIDILQLVSNSIIDYSFKSAIDPTEPTTQELNIDYCKLLASNYIQRTYFSRLKPDSNYGCNKPNIQSSLRYMTETLTFLFDSKDKNVLTKFLMDNDNSWETNYKIIKEEFNKSINLLGKSNTYYENIKKSTYAYMKLEAEDITTANINLETEIEGKVIQKFNNTNLINNIKDYILYLLIYYINVVNKITPEILYDDTTPSYYGKFIETKTKIFDIANFHKLFNDFLTEYNKIHKIDNKISTYVNSYASFTSAKDKDNIMNLVKALIELLNTLFKIDLGNLIKPDTIEKYIDTYELVITKEKEKETYNKKYIKTQIPKIKTQIDTTFNTTLEANIKSTNDFFNNLNEQFKNDFKSIYNNDNKKIYNDFVDDIILKNIIKIDDNAYTKKNISESQTNVDISSIKDQSMFKILKAIYQMGYEFIDLTSLLVKTHTDEFNKLNTKSIDFIPNDDSGVQLEILRLVLSYAQSTITDIKYNIEETKSKKKTIKIEFDHISNENFNKNLSSIKNLIESKITAYSKYIKIPDDLKSIEMKFDTDHSTSQSSIYTNDNIKELTSNINKITKYRYSIYEPEDLAKIDDLFGEKIPVDFSLFKTDNFKIVKLDDKILFMSSDSNPNRMKHFINALIRIQIISRMAHSFEFLDIEKRLKNKSSPIINIFDNNSLIDQTNKILYSDWDKITYVKEFEKQFDMKLLFLLNNKPKKTDYDTSLYDRLIEEKNSWSNNPSENWKDLANKLIPIYLLNVKQGFWINHSIRLLMRTLMYTTDSKYINSQILSKDIFNDKKYTHMYPTEKYSDKNIELVINNLDDKFADVQTNKSIGTKLIKNIRLLSDDMKMIEKDTIDPTSNTYKENRNKLIEEIIKGDQTLEEYYLSKYDIEKSIWLKLLITIQHLGANIDPLEYKPNTASSSKLVEYNLLDDLTKTPAEYNEKKKKFNASIKDIKDKTQVDIALSKSQILLLALTTREDKYEGVKKTIEFSDIITQISNPSCSSEITQQGGSLYGSDITGGSLDFNTFYNLSYPLNLVYNSYMDSNNTKIKSKTKSIKYILKPQL
jgi:hypothetical protein